MGNIWETCFLVPGVTADNCAGWVQAWGSIAAILAAALLFWAQGRRDRAARAAQASAEKAEEAKFALAVLEMALRALNDFERFYRPSAGRTWVTQDESLDEACAMLRDASLTPMFAEARVELLHVREGLAVIALLSRKQVGHIAGGSRADRFLEIARTRLVESKAAIERAAPGVVAR